MKKVGKELNAVTSNIFDINAYGETQYKVMLDKVQIYNYN